MSTSHPTSTQGPYEESRCLACVHPSGAWAPATIRRVCEDGTFKIEFDKKDMTILPTWHGVTTHDISFNDAEKWPAQYEKLCRNGTGFSQGVFGEMLAVLGLKLTDETRGKFWVEASETLFNMDADAALSAHLDRAQAYALIRHAGFSAQRLEQTLLGKPQARPCFRLYWNQTRMGGREPSEIGRTVTLDDAFTALGLSGQDDDPDSVAALKAFEAAQGLALPEPLKRFMRRRGIAQAVTELHPNAPRLVPIKHWQLLREIAHERVKADYGLVILFPNQGGNTWVAVFNQDQPDVAVYVRWGGEDEEDQTDEQEVSWEYTAPSLAMFFWDLAQTGLTWYIDTQFKGGKPFETTDIGVALKR